MKKFSIKAKVMAAATFLVVGGAIGTVSTADDAQAAQTCAQAAWGGTAAADTAMCSAAWKLANLSPLSNTQVIQYGKDWCAIKRIKGASVAYQSLGARIGATKANAIGRAADSWQC